jgi:hypothetical protein
LIGNAVVGVSPNRQKEMILIVKSAPSFAAERWRSPAGASNASAGPVQRLVRLAQRHTFHQE